MTAPRPGIFNRRLAAACLVGAVTMVAFVLARAHFMPPAGALAAPSLSCAADEGLGWDGASYSCIALNRPVTNLKLEYVVNSFGNGFGTSTAMCAGGRKVIGGGGYQSAPNNVWFYNSYPIGGLDGWECAFWNNSGTNRDLYAYAICADATN